MSASGEDSHEVRGERLNYNRYARIMGMLDSLSSECEEMEWKNDNSHSFDSTYLRELVAELQKQAQARELSSNSMGHVVRQQLDELRIKRQSIEIACAQVNKDLREAEDQCIRNIRSQLDLLEEETRSEGSKLSRMAAKSAEKIQQSIDQLVRRHQHELQVRRQELEAIGGAAKRRLAQLQAAISKQQQSYSESTELILQVLKRFYERYHGQILQCRQDRQNQRTRLLDLMEFTVARLRESV